MKSYSHNTKGLVGYAGHSPHRWHIVYLMLGIMIIIASSAQSPAQAAAPSQTAPTGYAFYLFAGAVKGNPDRICVGEPLVIRVNAVRLLTNLKEAGNSNPRVLILGVTVDGSINSSHGKIVPSSQVTSASSNPPGSAIFTFIPEKPGKTEIIFKGKKIESSWFQRLINGGDQEYLSTTLKVTVVECKFGVHIISHFSAQNVNFVATLVGEIKQGTDGLLTGVADVKWVRAYGAAGDCSGEFDVGSSKAKLTGMLDNRERLTLDVAYLPAVLSNPIKCKTVSKTITAKVTPDPLTFRAPDTIRVLKLPQGLYGPPYYSMKGSANIVVFPKEISQ